MQMKFMWHFILFDDSVNNAFSPPMTELTFQNHKNSIIFSYSSPGKSYLYYYRLYLSMHNTSLVTLDVFCRRRKDI